MPKKKKKLWEAEHAYYCNEGNYFASGNDQPTSSYDSWQGFLGSEGDSDPDYNLLFRWDWSFDGEDDDGNPVVHPDPYYRDGTLKLFWIGQRKGLYRWTCVSVCKADEPVIREWLTGRLKHLLSLWEPLV